MSSNRRQWLKQSSLAALGLGISLRSLAGEDYLPRNFGSETGLINLGSNENPYGISPQAKEAIRAMIGQAHRYHFNISELDDFKKQLADHYGVREENLLVTAGSGEGLNLLARHFSNGNIVTAYPTFGILPNTAKRIGTKVMEVALTANKVHDLDKMLGSINNNTSLVYICNPANPSSTIIKPAQLKNFCVEASKKTSVLIDEAYFDFLDAPDNESMISLIDKNPNILVIRTFSKIHALAGLRVGFIVAHPHTIKKLEENHFASTQSCLSALSMAAALASLKDKEHQLQSKSKNAAARKYAIEELTKMGHLVIPSYTNFIFYQLKNFEGDFAAHMLKKNILLRSNNYADGKWVRVSVGTLDEMKTFVMNL
jgi:histidinol-phosphate aminotransferase